MNLCIVSITGSEPLHTYALTGALLFFPLLDRRWHLPDFPRSPLHCALWLGLLLTAAALLLWQPQHLGYALVTLLTAALPEEWFFRVYFIMSTGIHGAVG